MIQRMGALVVGFILATLLSTSHADFKSDNPIKMGRRSADLPEINCLSFRYGVEAKNLRDWPTIPTHCKSSLKSYLSGKQYGLDIEAVVGAAYIYLEGLAGAGEKDAWIFDIEETLLSNQKYIKSSKFQYGANPLNMTAYYEYLKNSTELPAVYDLYKKVFDLGYKIFLVSEAPESFRSEMVELLANVGYKNHEKVVLKGGYDNGKSAVEYKEEKRREIVECGWNIVGNVGDQWSDLTGKNAGARTFKIPNPFYYIA